MGDKTKIDWATATWNIVDGCSPASEGCTNCYAANMAKRFWGIRKFSDIRFHPDRLDQPKKWKKPRRIFVTSMGDLFHPNVKDEWLDAVFDVMAQTPQHIYMLLTKRPERMRNYLLVANELPKHIWCGVTAENQEMADSRIETLIQVPAAVRFISVEPMLEWIDLKLSYFANSYGARAARRTFLNWVLCGCESGRERRYMPISWASSLKEQCADAGIPFFMKQLEVDNKISHDMNEWPVDLRVREYPNTEGG